jgi:hypothetical protein
MASKEEIERKGWLLQAAATIYAQDSDDCMGLQGAVDRAIQLLDMLDKCEDEGLFDERDYE